MLRDRYDPVDLFALVPRFGLQFDPQLAPLDRLLDDDAIFTRVRADLARRYPLTPVHGRHSTPVEVILRMLVVMRLYSWSYAQAEFFVNDSLVLRQFCRAYLEKIPDDTVLIRWANTIGPQTLQEINDRVVQLARSLKVTRGRKLRVDTTAVETNIHYPTDSALLGDGVRVLSRLLKRSKSVLGEAAEALGPAAFRSRVRTVRRLAQQLHRLARRTGAEARDALKAAYGRLIDTARRTGSQARRVAAALVRQAKPPARRLAQRIGMILPLLIQGIAQATRRVLEGEEVPAPEKLLSLFEPHTQIIPRFKAGKPVEFGRKLVLDEVEGGIVSGYRIVDQGGGPDQPYLKDSLETHQRLFGRPPDLLAGDRGLASAENERLAREAGVKRIALPWVGRASPARQQQEKARWFRRGYRFRAGIEGRIHVLRRDYGLKRCRDHGEAGRGRWVGWGVVAHNLSKITGAAANG
jgi:IS5 family transposase